MKCKDSVSTSLGFEGIIHILCQCMEVGNSPNYDDWLQIMSCKCFGPQTKLGVSE